ncbi:MAG TPA: hypothetical protein VM074_05265 [Solimonas sp.]|nr:hypothetical protein [Solimonas sp.]
MKAAGVALLLAWAAAGSAAPGTPQASDEPLILAVQLDRQTLADLPALRRGEAVLLPIGQLSALLSIAIDSNPQAATATGFVLREDRALELDARAATLTLGGKTTPVDPAMLAVQPDGQGDDVYVDATLLARWLPLDLEVDLPALTLAVRPREPLPLQQKLDRQRLGALLAGRAPPDVAGYLRRDSPYRLIETPYIDASAEALQDLSANAARGDARYSLFVTGDLLWMEGALYAAGGLEDGSHEFRGTLERTDPEGGLLGPLDARRIAIGNVPMAGLPYISRASADGLGLYVSDRAASRSTSLGRHSLQGDLLPGWDVELYLNGVLLGLAQSGIDQRYQFSDLLLGFGVNEFRLVFHGPQGQERVERQTVMLEDSVTAAGEFDYRVALQRSADGAPRAEAQFDYGLSRHLSATLGFAELSVAGSPGRYAIGGLRGLWGPSLFNADYIHSPDGGSLLELGGRVRVRDWTFAANQAWMRDFRSELFVATADPVQTRQELSADGFLPFPGRGRLRVGVHGRVNTLASGASVLESALNASAFIGRTALANEVRWLDGPGPGSLDGTFQGSRRVGGVGLRGQIGYAIAPDAGLRTVALSADRRLGERYALTLSATRSIEPADTLYAASLNKTQGRFAFGVVGRYSALTGPQIGVNLFVSAGRDPLSGGWTFSAVPAADSGSIAARVFVDRNANGIADAGEEPVANAQFRVNGGRRTVKTGADGRALLDRLPPREIAYVSVEGASLEDPQLSPPPGGVRSVPRPGHVAVLDFPVLPVGEIEGTVYARRGAGWNGTGAVDLELQDRHGRVVSRAQSAADGYYLFQSVPPGDYLLVLPDQLEMKMVSIGAEMLLISGIDFRLDGPADAS